MPYKLRTRICSKCSTPFTGRLPPVADVLCIDCAVDVAADTMRQMAARSGPRYDRWLQSGGNPNNRPRDYKGR
jgi:hypothetical protein